MNGLNIEDFDFIWDKWIVPATKKIANQMDEQFKQETNFRIRDLSEIKKKAAKYYVKKREAAKKEYYSHMKNVSKDERLMDFHKLSAILCRTLMEYKVFYFDVNACNVFIEKHQIDSKDTDWLVHNALVNFRMAFYVSVIFLYQSMLFLYEKEDPNLYNQLLKQKKLNLYTKVVKGKKSHESFENSLVLDLAKRDVNNRSFDCFLYSAIMYQLEEYNKILIKGKP